MEKKNKVVLLEFYDEPSKFYLDIYKKSIVGNDKVILTAITSNLADKISELLFEKFIFLVLETVA